MKNKLLITACLLSACGSPEFSRVTLSLGEAPERIESLSVFVVDVRSQEVVAGATVSPSKVAIELGVPSERPLVFHGVARTNEPGPAALSGRLPAFAARSERTIPLGRMQSEVELQLRPAGAVEILVKSPSFSRRPILVRADGERAELPFLMETLTNGDRRYFGALEEGRWAVSAPGGEAEPLGSGTFYVEAESDNVACVHLDKPAPESPVSYRFKTSVGATVVTSSLTTTKVDIDVQAFDSDEEELQLSDAVLTWSAVSSMGVELVPNRTVDKSSIPQTLSFAVSGTGWFCYSARSQHPELPSTHHVGCLDVGPDLQRGSATRLQLVLPDAENAALGGQLVPLLLDNAGRLAEVPLGTKIRFDDSDPQADLAVDAALLEDGFTIPMTVASSRRTLPVIVRASASSTELQQTWTSTLSLAPLEIR